ncbi:MAG: hypothetical protein Q4C30_08685 [Bacteroidia bacterium]|nr:hypothetical protein [Bacteroidia bacterium]
MADNYLEKRMDEHRNGGSAVVVRRHKMPKKRCVLVCGCSCGAHVEVVKSLCNGGHSVYIKDVAEVLVGDVRKTLARFEIPIGLEFDAIVVNNSEACCDSSRVILTQVAEEAGEVDMTLYANVQNFNILLYPRDSDGIGLGKFIRFIIDSDVDVMNRQVVKLL